MFSLHCSVTAKVEESSRKIWSLKGNKYFRVKGLEKTIKIRAACLKYLFKICTSKKKTEMTIVGKFYVVSDDLISYGGCWKIWLWNSDTIVYVVTKTNEHKLFVKKKVIKSKLIRGNCVGSVLWDFSSTGLENPMYERQIIRA